MIHVRGLTHTYDGRPKPAIEDLNFDVNAGEVFGFLGPSGAGKSTTQNVLIGLLRGWQGTVEVMGHSIKKPDATRYAAIGVSFEAPNHYLKLTARENLEYFRGLYPGDRERTEDVLALVGLEDHIDRRVETFSKGMKNRLNFARSLLNKPKLWFLDEPTSGLDPVNAVRIRDLVKQRQAAGVTTVITTHDMRTAETICDRVAFIVDGHVAAIDTPDNLRRQYGRREVEVRWGDPNEENAANAAIFALDGLADNPDFLAALRKEPLSSIHSKEANLEEVFAQVTGRTLT